MIDFDEIDEWAPELTVALNDYVPGDLGPRLSERAPDYIEDARDILFELCDRDSIIDATLAWIRSSTIAGYHGTRLVDAEVALIRTSGLLPLKAQDRRTRLMRALSFHPGWLGVVHKIDDVLRAHGAGARAGQREGQVHLTLSRYGLVNNFNHYLTHGAEFDQHVAYALLGPEGKELLRKDGAPTLIRCGVPGGVALDASHPFFSIDDLRSDGVVPNLVKEFLESWSYKLAHPDFQVRTQRVDCGMFFCAVVPVEWIVDIEMLSNQQ